jgi:hypothetical protein
VENSELAMPIANQPMSAAAAASARNGCGDSGSLTNACSDPTDLD